MTPRSHPTRLSRIQLLSPLPYRKLRTEIRHTISEIEDHIDLILTVATTHIKRRGTYGDSTTTPAESFCASRGSNVLERSPNMRLPTWSWFCEKITNCDGRILREEFPCRR